MSWTPDTFIAAYPEFAQAGPIIDAALAQAANECDPTVFNNASARFQRLDDAVGALAAHILCQSPFARTLKLESVNDDQGRPTTKYWLRYDQIRRQVAGPLARFVL